MITRRELIGAAAVAPVLTLLPQPAVAIREPYVEVGESVDSLIWHLWDDPRNPAPIGPLYVGHVHPWDGKSYPITLMRLGWSLDDREYFEGFYDHEWSNLRIDVPARFWHNPLNAHYPNVQAYVREKRFGEHPSVMLEKIRMNRLLQR